MGPSRLSRGEGLGEARVGDKKVKSCAAIRTSKAGRDAVMMKGRRTDSVEGGLEACGSDQVVVSSTA